VDEILKGFAERFFFVEKNYFKLEKERKHIFRSAELYKPLTRKQQLSTKYK
jgi:hypothetical protein